MLDVNSLMAEVLRPVGLPACEDPMRENVASGAYITWENVGVRDLWASGERYMRQWSVQLTLWVLDDALDWLALRDRVIDALNAWAGPSAPPGSADRSVQLAVTGFSGGRGWDAPQGRAVDLTLTITEHLWQTQPEDGGDAP